MTKVVKHFTTADLKDGIIEGKVRARYEFCAHCSESTIVVQIEALELPEGIKPSTKLIGYAQQVSADGTTVGHVRYLGIGCGCYARFHRQIAHITTAQKKK